MNHFKISFYKTQVIFLNSTKIKQLKAFAPSRTEDHSQGRGCPEKTIVIWCLPRGPFGQHSDRFVTI